MKSTIESLAIRPTDDTDIDRLRTLLNDINRVGGASTANKYSAT
jgi:hypothetical protein